MGKALAVRASAVEDLPNVMGNDAVCKESLGRLFGADRGARASMSLAGSEFSELRLLVLPGTPCVESAGAVELIARASMFGTKCSCRQDQIKTGWSVAGPCAERTDSPCGELVSKADKSVIR